LRFRSPPVSPSSYSTTGLYLGPPRIDRRWTSVADYVSGRRGRKSRRREVNLRIAYREENHSGVLPRKTLLGYEYDVISRRKPSPGATDALNPGS